MEESKELQGFYKIFRAVIYVSILMEFFAYALEPEQLDFLGGVVTDIHGRIKRCIIYCDGNLVYSKVATFLHGTCQLDGTASDDVNARFELDGIDAQPRGVSRRIAQSRLLLA